MQTTAKVVAILGWELLMDCGDAVQVRRAPDAEPARYTRGDLLRFLCAKYEAMAEDTPSIIEWAALVALTGLEPIERLESGAMLVRDDQGRELELSLAQLAQLLSIQLVQARDELHQTLATGQALMINAAACLEKYEYPYGDPWRLAPDWANFAEPQVRHSMAGDVLVWYYYENDPKVAAMPFSGHWTIIADDQYEPAPKTIYRRGDKE